MSAFHAAAASPLRGTVVDFDIFSFLNVLQSLSNLCASLRMINNNRSAIYLKTNKRRDDYEIVGNSFSTESFCNGLTKSINVITEASGLELVREGYSNGFIHSTE